MFDVRYCQRNFRDTLVLGIPRVSLHFHLGYRLNVISLTSVRMQLHHHK